MNDEFKIEGEVVDPYIFLIELLPTLVSEDDKQVRADLASQGLDALKALKY